MIDFAPQRAQSPARADTRIDPSRYVDMSKPPGDDLASNLPQAGNPAALTPAVMAAIASRVTPDRIADGIDTLLSAMLSNGQPDVRAVESGIKLYLNYMVGLPVQRIETLVHKVSSIGDSKALLRSPATLEAISRQLAGTPEGERLIAALSKGGKGGKGGKGKSVDDEQVTPCAKP